MRALLIAAALLLGWTGAIATADAASVRALLIGVDRYPGLPADLQLAAPAGDARRMAAALADAGVAPGGIEVLGGEGEARPTRAAVLSRLDALAASARPGDTVIVYFSGHGDRQAAGPSRPASNLFLAADAGLAADTPGGAAKGAITDAELRRSFAAILSRGADVWFIADACHAYGLVRGAGGRVKAVRRTALAGGGAAAPLAPVPALPTWGRFTGFYAAGEGALALERRLPAGSPDAEPASVFTYALVRALAQGRVRSYRDLALATVAAETEVGPDAPAPVFEGELDRPTPGLRSRQGRQFTLGRQGDRWTLDAGALEGIDPGAELDLLDGAGRIVGRARVAEAGLTRAVLPGGAQAGPNAVAARLVSGPLPGAATRGERLLQVAQAVRPSTPTAGLTLQAWLWRAPRLAPDRCAANPPVSAGTPRSARPFDPLQPPPLRACDVVYLSLQNGGARAVDASPLYVDAEGRLGALALSDGDQVRLQPGASRLAAVRLVDRDAGGQRLPRGTERLVVLATPADPDAPPADLRTLADPARPRGRPSPLQAQIAAALDGPTRGAAAWRPPDVTALVIPLRLP